MKTAITRFTTNRSYGSKHGFGKSVFRDASGKVDKEAHVIMAHGRYETVEVEWTDFGKLLAETTPGEAFAYGVCCKTGLGGKIIREGRVITVAEEELYEASGEILVDAASRSKKNFKWHEPPCDKWNVLFIDIDTHGEETLPGIEESTERLLELFPDLGTLSAGCWAFASAGAYIYNDSGACELPGPTGEGDALLKGLTGLHVYFLVPPSIPISKVERYMVIQNWVNAANGISPEAGGGRFDVHPIKMGASVLDYGYVDFKVWQSERFDFVGGSFCAPGLIQKRPAPVMFEVDSWNPTRIPFEHTEAEIEMALKKKGEAKRAAQRIAAPLNKAAKERMRANGEEISDRGFEGIFKGDLPGDLKITFDNGECVPVWKLVFEPDAYTGRYCTDPLEPELGTKKAIFFFNEGAERENRYVIASYLHGGQTFRLMSGMGGDPDGVRSMIKGTDPEVLRLAVLTDVRVQEELGMIPEHERSQILDMLKDRKIGTKSEIAAKIEAARVPGVERKKKGVLEALNERFAYVTIKGKARYVEDTGKELIVRDRKDFLAETEAMPAIEIFVGEKLKWVPVGTAWLGWQGRKSYPGGMRFDPAESPREFVDRESGHKVLNRYRGFAFEPVTAGKGNGKCGGAACDGKGCVAWSLEELEAGRDGLCEFGGWTYWVKTIHDVASDGNIEHTRWIVDWFADILQAPGGRAEKGGRRSEVSLCLRGPQGTGKNSVVEPVMRLLGEGVHSMVVTDMNAITQNFNSYMQDMLLLFANEAIWGGSKKEANKLKALITDDWVKVEYKGIDAFQSRNFIRLFIASNSDWVVPAEDDERRYSVFDVTKAHVKDESWFAKVKSGDPGQLLGELLALEIKSNLYKNLETEALMEQKGYGRGVVEDFILTALDQNWFWDGSGVGLAVTHEEIYEKFEAAFGRRVAYAETNQSFMRKFRKSLKDHKFFPVKAVRRGSVVVGGVVLPSRSWFFVEYPWLKRELEE